LPVNVTGRVCRGTLVGSEALVSTALKPFSYTTD